MMRAQVIHAAHELNEWLIKRSIPRSRGAAAREMETHRAKVARLFFNRPAPAEAEHSTHCGYDERRFHFVPEFFLETQPESQRPSTRDAI
jgi:hypothetical protein